VAGGVASQGNKCMLMSESRQPNRPHCHYPSKLVYKDRSVNEPGTALLERGTLGKCDKSYNKSKVCESAGRSLLGEPRRCFGGRVDEPGRGKSGLHRTRWWVTPTVRPGMGREG